MNPWVQIGVSLVMTGAIWLAGHLVRLRIAKMAQEAEIDWPSDDIGIEVSPGFLSIIATIDLLHHIRFGVLGGVFGLNFLAVGWITERVT